MVSLEVQALPAGDLGFTEFLGVVPSLRLYIQLAAVLALLALLLNTASKQVDAHERP